MNKQAIMAEVRLVKESDGEELSVPVGETAIGRGPFLKVTDKRVSRLHATLRLKDSELALCPKHKNPCFYKAADESKFQTLQKDEWQSLSHGDSFSLLPDDLVFRVVCEGSEQAERSGDNTPIATDTGDPLDFLFSSHKATATASETTPTTEPTPMETDSPVRNKTDSDREKAENEPPSDLEKDPPTPPITKTSAADTERTLSAEDSVVKPKLVSSQSGSTGKRRTLPTWLSGLVSEETKEVPAAAKKRKAPSKANTSKKRVRDDDDKESSPPPAKKPSKKAQSTKAKARTDPEDTKPSSPKDKPPPVRRKDRGPSSEDTVSGRGEDSEAGSMSGRGGTKKSKGKEESAKGSKDKPPCPYGASCYRKNPVHFREYSHDFPSPPPASVGASVDSVGDDDDDDESDKPICPYGRDCYRKNPVHRREYKHLDEPAKKGDSGKRRSKRTTKGKRGILSGDSDDDGEPNTYDYNDSFIDDNEDDGGESSSYGGSEDSDWSPGVKDDSENIGELVSEAKDFMSNKKMRRTT